MTEDSSTSPSLLPEKQEPGDPDSTQERPGRRWNEIWEKILRLGLGEIALRIGTAVVSVTLILLVVWVMGSFYLKGQVTQSQELAAMAAPLPSATPTVLAPSFKIAGSAFDQGIIRLAQIHTILPEKPRFEINTYEVQNGDTVFGIAEKFGLQPQSILYGNFDTLADDPHRLRPGQVLNILPVDGVLYRWTATDGLNGVAEFFGVTPEDIITWPGNGLSEETIGDFSKPNIEADKLIFVPGGTRDFINWSAPLISRTDPAAAKVFGPGYCGSVYDGYIGGGTFVWPSTERFLSGYDWSPQTNHFGIDIGGQTGNAIYATDSGVVVYSGWHERGYGYVIIIDHGNGWQSLYAHLSQIYSGCGESVSQGAIIGLMGSTGNSTGPHLHFELMNASGTRVNPWNFLQ
ncbi:MAG: peptidoglycan DD-metalloendopeptidase family protein [Anaerolineaceae bacterium]|nr:peptidoglycan DD-metalloendopeptidase family protein [Anaerolineaceae bacterium]